LNFNASSKNFCRTQNPQRIIIILLILLVITPTDPTAQHIKALKSINYQNESVYNRSNANAIFLTTYLAAKQPAA